MSRHYIPPSRFLSIIQRDTRAEDVVFKIRKYPENHHKPSHQLPIAGANAGERRLGTEPAPSAPQRYRPLLRIERTVAERLFHARP
jgi:hypothetical protein